MNNGEKGGKPIKELVVNKCWQYLYDNFAKFSQPNKIKIALELAKKDMPSQVSTTPEFAEFIQSLITKKDLPTVSITSSNTGTA